jgi:hypothetical protein
MNRFVLSVLLGALLVGCGSPAPSPATIQKSCVFDISCEAAQGTPGRRDSSGVCVATAQTAFAVGLPFQAEATRQIECAASSTTCTDWQRCTSRDHGPSYCASHRGASCDGNLLIHCGSADGYGQPFDCAAYGLECRTANGSAACVDAVRTACDPTQPERCDGNRAIACNEGTREVASVDCGAVLPGSSCGVVAVGRRQVASCLPAGPLCQSGQPRCDGNTLVLCSNPGGREQRVDCAATFGGTCGVVRDRAQCVFTGGECSPESDDRCSGDKLEVCVNGRYVATECASLGFRTCGLRSFGGSLHYAVCMN